MLFIQTEMKDISEFFGKKTGYCVWCVAGVICQSKKAFLFFLLVDAPYGQVQHIS